MSARSRLSKGRQKMPSVHMSPMCMESVRSFWLAYVGVALLASRLWAMNIDHAAVAGSSHGLPMKRTPLPGDVTSGVQLGWAGSEPVKVSLFCGVAVHVAPSSFDTAT